VRELETELERSRWDNKTPNERFEQKIEEALDG
jgi:hypothetical protein